MEMCNCKNINTGGAGGDVSTGPAVKDISTGGSGRNVGPFAAVKGINTSDASVILVLSVVLVETVKQ